MCGRLTHIYTWAELRALMLFEPMPEVPLKRRYNVAPTQNVPVVRATEGGLPEVAFLRWGLVPSWAKDANVGGRMINARAGTVAKKPAFRSAYKRRQCVVPMSGFYEWQAGPPKQPWYIRVRDVPVFAVAGLWEAWSPPGEPVLETFTIVTTRANERLSAFHDRIPVILAPVRVEHWLDPVWPADDLLAPFPPEQMGAYRVGTRVNSPRVDEAGCVEPVV